MKKLLFFLVVASALGVIYKFGVLIGGIMILTCVFVTKTIVDRVEYSRTIDDYKTRYEDVFVISRNPDTEEEFDLPRGFDKFVVWADYEDVMEEVKIQKKWLVDADNKFLDDNLSEHQKIRVHAIIFQDGEFINEDWSEQFPERAIMEIKNKRVVRHGLLKKANADWYHKHGNHQRGVAWEPQKS